MQYEADSSFAAAYASVVTCALILSHGVPRPQAQLWEFDWQEAQADLEPAQDTVAALLRVGLHLARGGKLDDEAARSLWREMNRMPQIWAGTGGGSVGGGPCG